MAKSVAVKTESDLQHDEGKQINWTRVAIIFLGIGLFLLFQYMPGLPDAVDPEGKRFPLYSPGL